MIWVKLQISCGGCMHTYLPYAQCPVPSCHVCLSPPPTTATTCILSYLPVLVPLLTLFSIFFFFLMLSTFQSTVSYPCDPWKTKPGDWLDQPYACMHVLYDNICGWYLVRVFFFPDTHENMYSSTPDTPYLSPSSRSGGGTRRRLTFNIDIHFRPEAYI